ncbi:MAG: helix-turn-helix domain-containing protein [Candidatus Phocaeicola faecigallinarum]|uniref:Helix-turn-helix domain-containing protein n=1 Tax=Candidatus Phocaeicola faecigallinarum TaxID=2838732 RepID=A0A948WWQ0_9BACT|nr:helix-turn-helix domain-containing protein [Candidatus Phocaeicola faecigallinarum]
MGIDKINRIKIVLVEQGKTGKWLAEQLGRNEATVSRWCSNTSQPSLEILMKVAAILGVSAKDLINNGIYKEVK